MVVIILLDMVVALLGMVILKLLYLTTNLRSGIVDDFTSWLTTKTNYYSHHLSCAFALFPCHGCTHTPSFVTPALPNNLISNYGRWPQTGPVFSSSTIRGPPATCYVDQRRNCYHIWRTAVPPPLVTSSWAGGNDYRTTLKAKSADYLHYCYRLTLRPLFCRCRR